MIKQFDDVLEYVQRLCDKIKPELYEDGEHLLCGPSRMPNTFAHRYNTEAIDLMPDKGDFLYDEELMNAMQAFYLEVDKFWYAMLFIYDYITESCNNAHKKETSIAEKLIAMCELLQNDGATLTVQCEGEKKVIIQSKHDRDIFVAGITELLGMKQNDHFGSGVYYGRPINLFHEGSVTESDVRQIVLGARLYLDLFEVLEIDKIRKRGREGLRLDKMTLISRMLYITGIARNEDYNLDNGRLKKDLKKYRNEKMRTYSSTYL